MSTSPYQTGLGPKILSRARLIFGSLLAIFIIFAVAGIYQGIVSGDIQKRFVQPFQQFSADLGKALETKPIPSLTPVLSPIPTTNSNSTSSSTSTTKVIINQTVPAPQKAQPKQPVAPNCIIKNIREGEFASNKCYSQQDYDDLEYYLQRFSSAQFNLDTAESSMRITCNCRVQQECDFFKDSCERDTQQKSQAESDISKYRGTIQSIIAKGK